MSAPQRPPAAASGGEIALLAIGGAVLGTAIVTFAGAAAAAALFGGTTAGGLGEWLAVTGRLLTGVQPHVAWEPTGGVVPSGWRYWLPAGACYVLYVMVLMGLIVWRVRASSLGRVRFGQPTEAREAEPGDVVPLRIPEMRPPTGRMLLGRMAAHRKVLLATEDRERHPLTGKAARRQGNRGSVAMIGPTGSGKTAAVISAIATWDGPVVAVSVKRDLYDVTSTVRAKAGELAVFDPGAATGLPTARWSPLTAVTTASGALQTGRALAQAIPRSGVDNADFWAKLGDKLMGTFMCVAGLDQVLGRPYGISMQQISQWVTIQAGGEHKTILDLIHRGLMSTNEEAVLMARHAGTFFLGLDNQDSKIKSSIYTTASSAVDPWLEPAVAHSATTDARYSYNNSGQLHDTAPAMIDLEWLMSGNNTLYLAAPQNEFERLSPVLGGLLASLKDTLHNWDIAGRRLDKPLLIVIDEAGQLQLEWLPAEVSTIAALGAFFVTCWQSLAQVKHRYGTQSDAVLSGHRTKCFFTGMDDLETVNYLKSLLGSEYVHRRSWSTDIPSMLADDRGRRSTTDSMNSEEFAPANALRQMESGEAVLLHGTLPPVHLAALRWWLEPELKEILRPDEPKPTNTCPLTNNKAVSVPLISRSTLDEARNLGATTKPQRPTARAFKPDRPVPGPATRAGRSPQPDNPNQQTLALDTQTSPTAPEPVALPAAGLAQVVPLRPSPPAQGTASEPVAVVIERSSDNLRPRPRRCEPCGRALGLDTGLDLVGEGGELFGLCNETCLARHQKQRPDAVPTTGPRLNEEPPAGLLGTDNDTNTDTARLSNAPD